MTSHWRPCHAHSLSDEIYAVLNASKFIDVHVHCVVATANLRDFVYGIPANTYHDSVVKVASSVPILEFKLMFGVRIVVIDTADQELHTPADLDQISRIYRELPSTE